MIARFDYEHFDDGKPLAHWQLVGAVDHADVVGHGERTFVERTIDVVPKFADYRVLWRCYHFNARYDTFEGFIFLQGMIKG